jgi:cell division protein FtsN
MSPFALYLLALLLIIGALAFAAVLLNVPPIAVVVAVALALVAIGAWATRRPRLKPSKFTGEKHETPSLDPNVLTELKTELMQKPQASRTAKTSVMDTADPARTQATTRMPAPNDARTEALTRVDQGAATSKQPRSTPPDDRGASR